MPALRARNEGGCETFARGGLVGVSLLGLAVSSYLTWERAVHDNSSLTCVIGSSGGCVTVQQSEYAVFLGIPVAILGIVAYTALLLTALVPGTLARIAGLGTGIVSAGFSAWLTYLELYVIEAICFWCVISFILTLIALGLTSWRAWLGEGRHRLRQSRSGGPPEGSPA